MSAIVAIVGRPNVGKSTFFNRMIQKREAIVDAVSGVTRDRHYGKTDWNGRDFSLIDTGGYVVGSDDVFEKEIDKQVELAIEEADAIIFMVEVETGVTGMDEEVAQLLRRSRKPVFLAVNKVDNAMRQDGAVEFYSLGFEKIYPISGNNGGGSGELLDDLVKALPEETETNDDDVPRFAVVGRPNAGKSSFINSLIGEDRYIVTDIAGTTRDSIDTRYNRFGFEFNLIDTAGIRRKAKVKEDIEFYSVMRSVRAIEHCDVCILVVDATRGFDGQVQNIFWPGSLPLFFLLLSSARARLAAISTMTDLRTVSSAFLRASTRFLRFLSFSTSCCSAILRRSANSSPLTFLLSTCVLWTMS